jgi:hypothetical protein
MRILRSLAAAWLASSPALAGPAPMPKSAEEFSRLPALGKLIEGGAEKNQRFRTYLVKKRPTSTGAISIFVGEVHMRMQDISGGMPRPPRVLKWWYAARCSGAPNTISVTTRSLAPPERGMMAFSVMPGAEPDPIDRTWYNVWYAVCLDDFNKYPRTQEQ